MTKHFAAQNHSMDNISIQIMELLKTQAENKMFRLRREYHWIQQLKSVQPLGINSMEVSKWLLSCK
jgi:hypothetical protein